MVDITETSTRSKNGLSEWLKEENQHSVDEDGSGNDGQEDEPEPEEDVNLLVDNVQWENAESIVFLHITRGTISVEGTLGHSRKDGHHWVDSVLLVHFSVTDNIITIGGEGAAKEGIDQIHLNDDIDKVENFAKDEVNKVGIVESIDKSKLVLVWIISGLDENKPQVGFKIFQ